MDLDTIIEEGGSVGSKVLVSFLRDIKGEISSSKKQSTNRRQRIENPEQKADNYRKDYKEKVRNLTNEVTDLKERVPLTEVYMSQATIILKNPPVCDSRFIMVTVLGNFNEIFRRNVQAEKIKDILFLGKPRELAIIVKFLYFAQKTSFRDKKPRKQKTFSPIRTFTSSVQGIIHSCEGQRRTSGYKTKLTFKLRALETMENSSSVPYVQWKSSILFPCPQKSCLQL